MSASPHADPTSRLPSASTDLSHSPRVSRPVRHQHRVVAVDARSTPVLLIEMSPGGRVIFEYAFGPDVTVARSVAELDLLLRRGARWDAAFVGFHLGLGQPTGLTAMLRLIRDRPDTALVAYTQAFQNGSTLFAAAARHWLGVRSVVDTADSEPDDLRRLAQAACRAADCSSTRWKGRLQYAYLIDAVFANPSWILIWSAICESAADMQLTGAMLGVSSAHLRGFKDRATDAVNVFREKLSGISYPGNTRNKKGILSAFAAENRLFMTTPDLSAAMCPEHALIASRCS
jgi:hypothetical protein